MLRIFYSSLIIICLSISPVNVLAIKVQTNFSGYTERTNCINCEDYFESISVGDQFNGTLYYEFEETPELVPGQSIYETPLLIANYEIYFDEIVLSGSYYIINTDGAYFFYLQDESPSMTPEITDQSINFDELVIDLYSPELPLSTPFFPTSLDTFTHGNLDFWVCSSPVWFGFEFYGVIDNVQSASPVPTPEPATALMIVLGISGIVCRKKLIKK